MGRPRTVETPERKLALLRREYKYDPNRFAREVLHIDPDPWQVEANEAVADYIRWSWNRPTKLQKGDPKNFFTVSAMHGPGKTFWGAQLIHWFGFCMPDKPRIPCFAPKMEQLTTRLWPEIRKVLNSSEPFYRSFCETSATAVFWGGDVDWSARAYTASSPENLAGLHHTYQLAFCDEATGIDEQFWPVIKSALSTTGIQILVMISNPTKNQGQFAASWLKPNEARHFHQVKITLDKAPRVSKKWVAMMRDSLGEDSPIYKIRVLGEFAAMGSNQLISPQWLVDARNRALADREDGALRWDHNIGDGSVPKLRVSVDVADGGVDKSVITVMKHYSSIRFMMKQRAYSFPTGEAPLRIAEEAIRLFYQYGGDIRRGDDIVIDALGVGAGGAGRIMESKIPVVVYKGGAASDNAQRWRCRRVQSYMNARDDLRDGYVVFMPDAMDGPTASDEGDILDPWDEFDSQMCSVETRHDDSEKVEDLVTRKQMRDKGLKSPDRADSFVMQYATQTPSYMRRDVAETQAAKIMTVVHSNRMDGYLG